MSVNSSDWTARVLEKLHRSEYVVSSNLAIDVFSIQTSRQVKLKNQSQIELLAWLREKQITALAGRGEGYRYFYSKWNGADGGRTVFRPVAFVPQPYYMPMIVGKALERLLSFLEACTPVSTDQFNPIEPEDGVLAWSDDETGLMWDAGRLSNERHSNGPGTTCTLLNALNYAGFCDWRIPTMRELQTLRCTESTRGHYIKPPLAAMTIGPLWALSTGDGGIGYDFSTQRMIGDNYYKDEDVDAYDLCVRGGITNLSETWMNVVADWAARNDVSIPFNMIDLISLRRLEIHSQKYLPIVTIPDELRNLQKVEEVSISSVPPQHIPDFITKYPLLTKLRFSSCKFDSSVDLQISPSLTHLEINGGFSDLPYCLPTLTSLKYIYLTGCANLCHIITAKSYLYDFVAQGGKLTLGSYMKYEDFGLTKSLEGGYAQLGG